MQRTITLIVVGLFAVACGPGPRNGDDDGHGDGAPAVCPVCSEDKTAVVDCEGHATQCPPDQGCSEGMCLSGCAAADKNHSSVGCDYYGVDMDAAMGPPMDACYTMFVANVSRASVHMQVEWNGLSLNLGQYAKLPQGTGTALTYAAYDPVAGLAPGQVAILFLAYAPGGLLSMNVACPVPAAVGTDAQISGNGFGKAFHLTTDLPVVAYQMLPFGGGRAAATGASLLLPTSAWGTNYIAVSAYDPPPGSQPPIQVAQGPSYNIVAMEDATHITIKPNQAILGGGGLPAGAQGQPYAITLAKGQYAQITQLSGFSGSPVSSDKPIGMFGGHQIMSIDRCCGDHGEQMLAPVRALGSEYVAAPHADREPHPGEPRIYRIFGAVNETHLTYEPAGVGPATVNANAMLEIRTPTPFTVKSQDSDHPFSMFTYMSGAGVSDPAADGYDPNFPGGFGDADFVRLVPPAQYMQHYVFFTDVTYPFTVLTVVRKKHGADGFVDVTLDCLGTLSTWAPVGTSGEYEIAFVKLVDHFNAVGNCNNGVHTMDSQGLFGVWVWGWGSEDTQTGWVSYGYPAGESVLPINDVVILNEAPPATTGPGKLFEQSAFEAQSRPLAPTTRSMWTLAHDAAP